MLQGLIFDVRKFSIHDGPGIRTTVFFKGCPLACWWCHNPESQTKVPELWLRQNRCIRCGTCLEACAAGAVTPNGATYLTDTEICTLCGECVDVCPAQAREIVGRSTSVEQVLAEIERDIPFYDESGGGVTFSGGEPLYQAPFLAALLRACKQREIHTALDTSGFASWKTLDHLRQDVDLFLYDLKLMDERAHRHFTGVSNRPILANLTRLAQAGHHVVIRLPLVPGITDQADNLRQIGVFVAALPGPPRLDILPYHAAALGKYQRLNLDYRLAYLAEPGESEIQMAADRLAACGLEVHIGGS